MRTVKIVSGVAIALWLASWPVLCVTFPEVADRGVFGDSFGAVNSLFSGLALVGVVYAIVLQREELQLQREEMERVARAGELSARLAAISQLISFNDARYKETQAEFAQEQQAHGFNDLMFEAIPYRQRMAEIEARINDLMSDLEDAYMELRDAGKNCESDPNA